MRRLFFYSLFLGLLFAVGVGVAHAQVNTNLNIYNEPALQVVVTPTYPGPNQNVTIAVVSDDPSTDSAFYTWSLNGSVTQKGAGEKSFSFISGAVGTRDTVNLEVSYQNGQNATQTFTIAPADLDLIWEAKTYTPNWYEGKALYSPGTPLLIDAVPNFPNNAPAASLDYAWSQDGQTMPEYSGLGDNTLSIVPPEINRPVSFSVVVTDPKTNLSASRSVTIGPTLPFVLLYADDPLYGILNQTELSGTMSLSAAQISLRAEPFYFIENANAPLSYQWSVNSQNVQNPSAAPNEIELRSGGGSGISSISVEINDAKRIFADASAAVALQYGNQ